MKNIIKNIYRFVADIFLDESIIRKEKLLSIPQNITEHYRGDYPKLLLDEVIVATSYKNIEHILERYKYHSDRSYAQIFTDMLISSLPVISADTIITTVPMHWSRYTIRGYDHVDYLAKKLSKKT